MLFVFVRVELDNVRDLAIAETLDTLSSLRVPELDLSVVTTRKECSAVVGEGQVLDMFHVPVEGS